jgi:hypothetical protein
MSHRHATDTVALVFGTLFAGSTVVWLLWLADVIDYDAWWAGPVVLIVAGLVGLLSAIRPSRPDPSDPGEQASFPA